MDAILDRAHFVRPSECAVGEVEPQLVGPNRGAGLADVGSEPLAQRRVKQVGRGVVAHRRVAGRAIDGGRCRIAARNSALAVGDANRLVVADSVHVLDRELITIDDDHAAVGDLATALRIEGALLELDQGNAVAQILGRDHARARASSP